MIYAQPMNLKQLYANSMVSSKNQWIFSTVFSQLRQQFVRFTSAPGIFLIVNFASSKEHEGILWEGPWFWGSSGLFVTPWFLDFDANTMVISRMLVWIRLHNLPLHFWNERILSGIGKNIGKYLKMDSQRLEERIYTFARICVDVDLSKGLSNHIQLIHKQMN